jgi:hypothetical protein
VYALPKNGLENLCQGDETLGDAPQEGWPTVISDDELKATIKSGSSRTCQ